MGGRCGHALPLGSSRCWELRNSAEGDAVTGEGVLNTVSGVMTQVMKVSMRVAEIELVMTL